MCSMLFETAMSFLHVIGPCHSPCHWTKMSLDHFAFILGVHSLHTHVAILNFIYFRKYVAVTHAGDFSLHFPHV